MEKGKAGGLDLSCCLLIEEVGDSDHCGTDDGCDHKMLVDDVDDAESCSWDTSAADLEEAAASDKFQSSGDVGGGDHRCCGYEIVVLMSWSCWFGSNHLARRPCLCAYCNFSDVVVVAEEEEEGEEVGCSRRHGSRQIMNKNMEDRRFWETCLDVGYP